MRVGMTGDVIEHDVLERTRAFVQSTFLSARPEVRLDAETSLFGNEIIDSLGAMQLLEFLQSEFDLSITNYEVTEANFGSLCRIAEFVLAKRG
jgi:acyl carrier protein